MKRLLCALLLLCILFCGAAAEEAFSLRQRAEGSLTELYGYTQEEVARFVFEEKDGTVSFWLPEHPGWKYTALYDENGGWTIVSPFSVESWIAHPGEGAARSALRHSREAGWFVRWQENDRESLRDYLVKQVCPPQGDLIRALASGTAAEGVCGLFTSLYGPEYAWPAALLEWRDEVLAEYGLSLPEPPAAPYVLETDYGQQVVGADFVGMLPEGLAEAADRPELAGWDCLAGAYLIDPHVWGYLPEGKGLAAFQKDGRRLLTLVSCSQGKWSLYPLGESALYPEGTLRIRQHGNMVFSLIYDLPDGETAAFQVIPNTFTSEGEPALYCSIVGYTRMNRAAGEALRVNPSTGLWLVRVSRQGEVPQVSGVSVRYPAYLGAADIMDFPTTLAEAQSVNVLPPGLESGTLCVSGAVHLRGKTSSHSQDKGMLRAGVLLPVLETLPGSVNPWIHTKLGDLEGYVSADYTSLGGALGANAAPPLPVAKARKEITLKRGTSLLDGTVATLPAGTKMHVVLTDGDWCFAAVPQGEPGWFMDPASTYGYVRKTDLTLAGLSCQLDWME